VRRGGFEYRARMHFKFFFFDIRRDAALTLRLEISLNELPDCSHAAILPATASAPSSLIEHSQTMATFQPNSRSASRFRLSRFTVSANFDFQNRMLDEGLVQNAQCSCRCQKQPCTSIIALCLGSTMSGRPGSLATCRRYRSPRRCSSRLRPSSGLVSFPRIPAIILERVILSTTSIIRSFPGVCRWFARL
jgi:hypothetical protein